MSIATLAVLKADSYMSFQSSAMSRPNFRLTLLFVCIQCHYSQRTPGRPAHGLKPVTHGLRGRDRESCAPSFSSGRFPLSEGLESLPDEWERQPILNPEF